MWTCQHADSLKTFSQHVTSVLMPIRAIEMSMYNYCPPCWKAAMIIIYQEKIGIKKPFKKETAMQVAFFKCRHHLLHVLYVLKKTTMNVILWILWEGLASFSCCNSRSEFCVAQTLKSDQWETERHSTKFYHLVGKLNNGNCLLRWYLVVARDD